MHDCLCDEEGLNGCYFHTDFKKKPMPTPQPQPRPRPALPEREETKLPKEVSDRFVEKSLEEIMLHNNELQMSDVENTLNSLRQALRGAE